MTSGCCLPTFCICSPLSCILPRQVLHVVAEMDAIFLVTKLATHGKCLFSSDSSKVPVGKAGAAFPGSGRRLSPKKSLWLVACVSQMNKGQSRSCP